MYSEIVMIFANSVQHRIVRLVEVASTIWPHAVPNLFCFYFIIILFYAMMCTYCTQFIGILQNYFTLRN